MRNYFTFMQKEITENLRTKRFFALACVFFLFAMLSPLMIRYMPEIMEALLGDDLNFGFFMTTTWRESYADFFGSIATFGGLTVILVFMGSILRERRNNTIDLLVTKGLNSAQFIMAKFTIAAIGIFVIFAVSVAIAAAYTYALFESIGYISDLIAGSAVLLVYLLLLLAIALFFSTVAKSTAIAAVLSLGAYFLLSILSAIPRIGAYSPGNLVSANINIVTGFSVPHLPWNLAGAIALSALLIIFAIMILDKQES